MEKAADRRFQTVKAFIEALREVVGNKAPEAEVTATGVAVFVEIKIADGADAESDELLDDASAILDATERSLRAAGMSLPIQTGSAIMGARVLSEDVTKAAGERDAIIAMAKGLAQELGARSTAHSDLHVNIVVHVGRAVVKVSADAPGGKEVVGGELLSTADWAPQQSVDGIHLTDAARR